MLTELCGYLKNWFQRDMYYGDFVISNDHITYADGTELPLQDGQYFRIIDSVFNDGIHIQVSSSSQSSGEGDTSPEHLTDEAFSGSVWALAIPKDVIDLADEIKAWKAKYEGADSPAMSPYNSESFGGYSYSKSGGSASDGSGGNSWQGVFGNRLMRYRKV